MRLTASCLWGGEKAALGLQQRKLNTLSKTLGLKHPMGWRHYSAPTKEPRCAAVGALQP